MVIETWLYESGVLEAGASSFGPCIGVKVLQEVCCRINKNSKKIVLQKFLFL